MMPIPAESRDPDPRRGREGGAPPAWAYLRLVYTFDDLAHVDETELNGLGAAGWELVGLCTDERSAHFYFKRPA